MAMRSEMKRQPWTIPLWALILTVALWPFIYYYRLVIPSQAFSLAVGNDFDLLYYPYKAYLLDMLSVGHFPLWSPSEAAGFPLYSSPFAQAFYPLNLLLMIFYKTMGGYSVCDHQAFTVLGLALYAVGLCLWLQLLVKDTRAVLFATLVITISFRLGDIMRFSNAVHAAAWMPWILYGVTLVFKTNGGVRAGLLLFLACVLLLTSGYPYFVYYCLFLVPPYVLLLLWSPTRAALYGEDEEGAVHRGRSVLVSLGAATAAVLLCGPYLVKMSELLGQTVDRAASSYPFATLHEFFIKDTIGSLVFPPAAQTEGWYYFGVLGVLLLTLWIAGALRGYGPGNAEARLALISVVWMALITYVTYGKHSYLFDVLWNALPGFSRLRVWSRLNIVMLPLLALCLCHAYRFMENVLTWPDDQERRRTLTFLMKVLIAASLMVGVIQVVLYKGKMYNFYWGLHFSHVHGSEVYFLAATAAAFAFLLVALVATRSRLLGGRGWLAAFLIVCLGLTVSDLRPVGARQWLSPAKPEHSVRRVLNMPDAIAQSLTTLRNHETDVTIALQGKFNTGYLENWYFQRYLAFHARAFSSYPFGKVANPDEVVPFCRLLGLEDGNRFFFSRKRDYGTIREFLRDADAVRRESHPRIQVVSYDGDSLVADVELTEPLFLSFIDNWDPDWIATVNDHPVPLMRLFGTFKAVGLPTGRSLVRMEYRPFPLFRELIASGG